MHAGAWARTGAPDGGRAHARGFTLVEMLVTLGVVAVLAAIALPSYRAYQQLVRIDQARKDIVTIATAAGLYWNDARAYPDDLSQIGQANRLDPWGRPYQYLNLGDPRNRGQARKDHSLVPINSDFDLYSLGPDGQSSPPLTARNSRDDIVRANDGRFVGVAADY